MLIISKSGVSDQRKPKQGIEAMARKPIRPQESLPSPKDFILPEDWDKKLKIKFSYELRENIEHKVNMFIIRHLLKAHSLSFEEVEHRLNQIIDGASLILKGFPYPVANYWTDKVHALIDWEITQQLDKSNNGDNSVILGMKMHNVIDIKNAATSALNELKAAHPPLPARRPSDDNADWLIYDLGLIFEQAGGRFSMPKSPGPNHPFFCFLQTINKHIPDDLQFEDSNLINRSIKLIRNRKKMSDQSDM